MSLKKYFINNFKIYYLHETYVKHINTRKSEKIIHMIYILYHNIITILIDNI